MSQVRFLNLSDGWAFGPGLFATHDSGRTWTPVATSGLRVTTLETVGEPRVRAVRLLHRDRAAFAAQCTSYTLYSSPAAADAWTPVGASTSGLTGAAASLVLTGTRGYLLAPDRMLYAGPVDGSAPWQAVQQVPCAIGPAQADGQPAGALLAAASAASWSWPARRPRPGGPAGQAGLHLGRRRGRLAAVATAPPPGWPPRWPPHRPGP